MIPENIQKLYDEIIANPSLRGPNFYKIGQEYFLPLHGRVLQEAVIEMWEYFGQNHQKWIGQLVLPDFYRSNKKRIVLRDFWYNIKEFFLWATIYPDELKDFFNMTPEGEPLLIGDQKIRLISKEVIKETFRENGKYQTRLIKPALERKLPSGFTIAQKHDIFDSAVVGFVKDIKEPFKTVEKTVKKTTKSKKSEKPIETNNLKPIETIVEDCESNLAINDTKQTTKKIIKKVKDSVVKESKKNIKKTTKTSI